MGNIVLATQALMGDASFSSGAFAGSGPPQNLIAREPSDALILTDLSNLWVEIDLGSAQSINLIAGLYVSGTSALTWRVRGAASEADLTGSPGYDSTALAFGNGEAGLPHRKGYLHDWIWLGASPQTWRWWRIDFADAANPDNRLVVGKIVLDSAFQPSRNRAYGDTIGLVDPSVKPRTVTGRIDPLARPSYMAGDFSLSFGSEADLLGTAFTIDEKVGITGQVLYLRNPDATSRRQQQAIYGLQTQIGTISQAALNIHEKKYSLEELVP